jgi:hypothetical protein
MSMMINPTGGGQIIAAGQPFKLRMKKKRPAETEPDLPEPEADAADAEDGGDETAEA